ncbi:nuclease [Lysobacter daejeonensis GH1-9]|uniref:phospholipase D n=1 Tax=Lysobacter daejeonensis GH1-9 TaxID=1385517 RepID=A0A0A0EY35_9GAMM|nr:phospholipase D-like domain-containing protein [Lysobacter daejeonensis]KGM54077.1 nuclease [Lysobacter daejeonensis GH1-9]
MDFSALDQALREFALDGALDNDERFELRNLGGQSTAEQVRFMRNRAFAITREAITAEPAAALGMLRWLEQVVKTLDATSAGAVAASTACFSPGDACLRKLRELCRQAKASIDVCVFTIADDRLTEALLGAHARGVRVRIISDNDKRFDDGSDIARLAAAGIPLRLDRSICHMHHKFAVFEGGTIANGSFNWTRTASTSNFENLVVSADPYLVGVFTAQFERLWNEFEAVPSAAVT